VTDPRSWARRIEVPADARTTLPEAQYAVAFRLEPAGARTPEQWARAALEGSPLPWRWVLMIGWRYVLGLQLGPARSRWHVQGWPIAGSDDKSVALVARSRLLEAANVFQVDADAVTWVTLVRYQRPVARLLWGALAPVHQLTVPPLLARAARAGR